MHKLDGQSLLSCDGNVPPAGAMELGFEDDCGLAAIRLATRQGDDVMMCLGIAVEWLSRLGSSLHAVAIDFVGCPAAWALHSSERGVEQTRRVVGALHALGVPIVSSASEEIVGLSVSVCVAADYRVVDQGVMMMTDRFQHAA
eukprot:4067367-Prymnesium_polylepis.1